MYFVYIDESGKPTRKESTPFVVAAFIIREKELNGVELEVTKLRLKYLGYEGVHAEIHGKEIVHGKGFYSKTEMSVREKFLRDLYSLIGGSPATLIASVVKKEGWGLSEREAREAIERVAYQYLLERVTLFFDKINCDERVLLIIDEVDIKHDVSIRDRIRSEIREGLFTSRRKSAKKIIKTPLFAPSVEHVGLQLADLVAYAVFKIYSSNPRSAIFDFNVYFKLIEDRFDRCRDGRLEGCGIKVW